MIAKLMTAGEVDGNFKEVAHEVEQSQRPVIVESGSDAVAIIPLRLLRILESERAAAFAEWRAIAERVNLSEEEADALINEAIAESALNGIRTPRPDNRGAGGPRHECHRE